MEVTASGAVRGEDGLLRCPWGLSTPDYVRYHDEEWGRPVTSTSGLYERLTLEAFQSGLSWLTILRKREGFRDAFAGFDPEKVAAFDADDVARLLADARIVRNRLKIEAAVDNARAVVAAGERFAETVLSFAEPDRPRPATLAEVPAQTVRSKQLSRELKGLGLRFVGPTTAYALMQAVGLVDDHLVDCHVEPGR
ncbi:DNA-3-methyladenine glycosylase I [Desertihabitans aurantiacus]|uniref:DNA-3-methyladenine glycosylase I n=1 Tax=Desertihabitans aurantiacus TaxID=2282477 RepID=UPI0022B7F2BE|nr:DNA-3-methyladenine glycosylase I [Desertihabitans aurantiacus]